MPNLTREDLRAFLPQYDLPDGQTDMVIMLVRSWLLDATNLDVLPDPLPEVLWGAAVELASLLASNPESLAQKTVGPTSRAWPMASRRDAILQRVTRRYRAAQLAPTGAYGDSYPYPEPVAYRTTVPDVGGWLWGGPR